MTPLSDTGLECLLTQSDYELLCRKQDEGRLMKLEINDEGDSEKSDSDAVISSEASVSVGEINSEKKIVIATIKENEPRNKQDGTVKQKRISVTRRFLTPCHPEGNSCTVRYQAVIIAMIHHAVHSEKKDWHRLIPYGFWTYREIPNATTRVSPYEMVYGRPARGVFAALKETWTGEQVFPSTLAASTKSYLEKLQEDLEKIKLWVEKCSRDQPKGSEKDPGATFQV